MSWTMASVAAPPRGAGDQGASQFFLKAARITSSWGAQPGTATLEYVSSGGTYAPIAAGASLTITSGFGHWFYGICRSDTQPRSSQGAVRTLEFADVREFLSWDKVYCAFNQVEKRMVNGASTRRYWHILPADFDRGVRTYSLVPYTAAQILDLVFAAPTVGSPWAASGPVYHDLQRQFPVFDVDCEGGKDLGAVLVEISEKQGLVFALQASAQAPYKLVWARKGVGPTVSFPARSDNRRLGVALSGKPTRVRVLGGRNLYQVTNVAMRRDWNSAWEQFYTLPLFEDDVFQRLSMDAVFDGIPAGTRYNAIPGDTDHFIGEQLAAARAATITVREYASLRGDVSFYDSRLFMGRSRNDIPAALYINALLWRAFRAGVVGFNGVDRPLDSMAMVSKMPLKVTHDPAARSLPMTYDLQDPPQGNGYAVVRGYNVGTDMFGTLRPERFSPSQWLGNQELWQHVAFQQDDSGEDGGFILFDEPVIRSADLVSLVDGFAVINAAARLTVPDVMACLVFEAERFSYVAGAEGAARDHVEAAPSLRGEFVLSNGGVPVELPYDDGKLASEKAAEIAASILGGQYSYAQGGYTRPLVQGDTATQLTGVIDRVTYTASDAGYVEEVDFTTERTDRGFTPDRDFDRKTREKSLLPGEAELRAGANAAQLTAVALKQSPALVKTLTQALTGGIGSGEAVYRYRVASGTGSLPVGTPLFAAPGSLNATTGQISNSQAVMPSSVTSAHSRFLGVTVQNGQPATRPVQVQRSGPVLARVQGPVAAGDRVVKKNGADYLVGAAAGDEGAPEVGTVQHAISGASTRLVEVLLGGSGGGTTPTAGDSEARWA